MMVKLLIDTKGGDNGVAVMVKGAGDALKKFGELSVVLVGDDGSIREECERLQIAMDRVEIVDAKGEITNFDNPAEALFRKTDSSMLTGLQVLAERDDIFGMITAGNTGVLLTGAMRYVSGKDRVRPALAAVLPSADGGFTCLVDTGATIDCTPQMLHHFAKLGSDFMKMTYGIENPRVGLLSNGSEPTKGNKLVKETHPILAKDENLNFVGNVEGRDIPKGVCDVAVCDGFTGNLILKTYEGVAITLMKQIKHLFADSTKGKLAAALVMKDLKFMKKHFDYNAYGGAPILGTSKPVFKAHGDSKAVTIKNAIKLSIDYVNAKAIEEISSAL